MTFTVLVAQAEDALAAYLREGQDCGPASRAIEDLRVYVMNALTCRYESAAAMVSRVLLK